MNDSCLFIFWNGQSLPFPSFRRPSTKPEQNILDRPVLGSFCKLSRWMNDEWVETKVSIPEIIENWNNQSRQDRDAQRYGFHIVLGGTFGYGVCTRFLAFWSPMMATESIYNMASSENGGSPKWMVYFMEHPKITWMIWGYPHFRKPPHLYIYIYTQNRLSQVQKKPRWPPLGSAFFFSLGRPGQSRSTCVGSFWVQLLLKSYRTVGVPWCAMVKLVGYSWWFKCEFNETYHQQSDIWACLNMGVYHQNDPQLRFQCRQWWSTSGFRGYPMFRQFRILGMATIFMWNGRPRISSVMARWSQPIPTEKNLVPQDE